jgi:hypothetical protein
VLLVATGCTTRASHTLVEGRMKPSHFMFETIIEHDARGPGGWRAACVHLVIKRTTGTPHLCIFSTEVPIETGKGILPLETIQRKAASCANLAADSAFASTTPATPLGLACESFLLTFRETLKRALPGSRVVKQCRE